MANPALLLFFLISITITYVNSVKLPAGVCTKETAHEVSADIPIRTSYDDYVREPCFYNLITCTVKRRNYETRMTKKIEHHTELECCDGYREDENGDCKPICLSRCVNGECVAPDVCQCWKGYFMDHTSDNHCHKIPNTEIFLAEKTNSIEVSKLIDNDENHNTRSAIIDVSIVALVLIGVCVISYFSYRAFCNRKLHNVHERDLESSEVEGQIALVKRRFFPCKFGNIVKV